MGEFFVKENLTELVYILDRSGSMQGPGNNAIGSFNDMIYKQKKELVRLSYQRFSLFS